VSASSVAAMVFSSSRTGTMTEMFIADGQIT
jgi:hypothetical protein